MTDPGLSNRLRQHSRRAGLMVGVTMAVTIAICIGGFAAVYAGLAPILSDLVPMQFSAPTRVATRAAGEEARVERTPTPAPPAASEEATAIPTVESTEPAFSPTHQSNSDQSINFRSTAGVTGDNSNLLYALPAATPLQFLGERETVSGEVWMHFRNEDGDEGWIREIDSESYQP
jgi:hypothetical protein